MEEIIIIWGTKYQICSCGQKTSITLKSTNKPICKDCLNKLKDKLTGVSNENY